MLCTSLLSDTIPIHCNPLPLHPPVMNTRLLLVLFNRYCYYYYYKYYYYQEQDAGALRPRPQGRGGPEAVVLGSDKGILYYWGPTKESFTIEVRQRNPLLLGSDKGILYYWYPEGGMILVCWISHTKVAQSYHSGVSRDPSIRSVFKISCLFLRPRPWQFEI